MDLQQREDRRERAVLFAIAPAGPTAAEVLLDELAALVDTAGGVVAGRLVQARNSPEPGTYLGTGKVLELSDLISHLEADLAVCDDELSPAQQRNLEERLGVQVLDRTGVILDIFAQRARSAEGKLQVEAAQLAYALPRLRGKGVEMSNPGAGIGTRGPGETRLETDRRKIRTRMAELKSQIEELSQQRDLVRSGRRSRGVPTVALVGYTNAGKSTLLNALTAGGAFAEDRLFATLDPTAREMNVAENRRVLLVDTVGFIRKLPHQLVRAFRATLEEVQLADVLIHVVDAASTEALEQAQAVDEVLAELGALDKPTIMVLNKIDRVDEWPILPGRSNVLGVSAVTGQNLEDLKHRIGAALIEQPQRETFMLPFDRGDILSLLHKHAEVHAVEYVAEGIRVTASVLPRLRDKIESELAKWK